MADGIYNAVSGAVAFSRITDVVANNLANASTAGFKEDRIAFSEVLSRATKGTTPDQRADSFVRMAVTQMDPRPGTLRATGNAMDLALEGPGYFAIREGNSELYSRSAALTVNNQGQLTNNIGQLFVDKNDEPIEVDLTRGALRINEDGTVTDGGGQIVGQLKLVEFSEPRALSRLGSATYEATPAAGLKEVERTSVRQGFREMGNVNLVRGMAGLITASRSYQALHNVISTFKKVDSAVVNKLGAAK